MALNDSDLFLVNQGGESKKITYANLKSNIDADGALWELNGTDIKAKNDSHNVKIGGGKIDLRSTGVGVFSASSVSGVFVNSDSSGSLAGKAGGLGLGAIFDSTTGTTTGYTQLLGYKDNNTNADVDGGLIIKVRRKGDGAPADYSEALRVTKDRNLEMGGTPGTAPAIELRGNGSVNFSNEVKGLYFTSNSATVGYFHTNPITNGVIVSAENTGLMVGNNITPGNGGSTGTIVLNANGSATFNGNVTAPNVFFNLEPDNEANYTVTTSTDEEGNEVETSVYNGPTLDVKDRIQNLIARLDAIEGNEIIDDAVDTSLLSLMASASARLDSIEARLSALEGGN